MSILASSAVEKTERFNKFLVNVFSYMGVAVFITAIVTLYISNSPGLMDSLFSTYEYVNSDGENKVGFHANWIWWTCTALELLIVIAISWGVNSLSASLSWPLFLFYAVLNGVTISPVIAAYTGSSVAMVFFISATVFGIAAVYGYTTKKDLKSFGSFFLIGLIGLIIAMVVNAYMGNPFIDYVISCVAVLLFLGITAWDIQMLEDMHSNQYGSSEKSLAVFGALSLYLDFINIFLHLLRLLGNRD